MTTEDADTVEAIITKLQRALVTQDVIEMRRYVSIARHYLDALDNTLKQRI